MSDGGEASGSVRAGGRAEVPAAATSPAPPPPPPPDARPRRVSPLSGEGQTHFIRDLATVRRRLIEEATSAVGMLDAALAALWTLDTRAAGEILKRDDRLDREEVEIEEAAFRLMALQQPVARDFRALAFVLKVNADIERVGDHSCSVAKIVFKLADHTPVPWPQALVELGQRVPVACHRLLRALLDEDSEAAKQIVVSDKTIDRLTRQLFDETVALMEQGSHAYAPGLLIYRLGRELERVGDLMTNIAEDIVYLATGEIIRHEKRRLREAAEGGSVGGGGTT